MAALMWHWQANVLEIVSADPSCCVVYEPRLPWIHRPSRRPEKQAEKVDLACDVIAAVWRTL